MSEDRRTIRVGVVGLGRGRTFLEHSTPTVGMELVALCDTWQERLAEIGEQYPAVATYADYEEFLTHDMDAVVLANYYHQHAPFAVKALEAGFHVMSETAACLTPAQGIELVEAVERTGRIYMLADNYPYMVFNQEMHRRFQRGDIGDFRYGEGEYVHPMDAAEFNAIAAGVDHWRNWIPATYYCSHSLAPLMYITGSEPLRVSGFVVPHDPLDANKARTVRRSDTAGLVVVEMSGGALVKLLQWDLRGHGNFVRVHGNRGLMENVRGPMGDFVRVRTERFEKPEGEPEESFYLPDFPVHHEEASRAGHGGGDFFMNCHFAEAIRTGEQPYFDVYRGVSMALVGILAYRSALDGSGLVTLPDLRDPGARAAWREDHWSPDPADSLPDGSSPPPSILGQVQPAPESLAAAREVWGATGQQTD